MDRLKKYIKVELAFVALCILGMVIFQLFLRHQVNTYDEKLEVYMQSLTTKEFSTEAFTKFYGGTDLKVELVKGSPKVVITTAEELIELIEISYEGDFMEISQKKSVRMDRDLRNASKIVVYFDELTEINAGKNCSVKVLDNVTNDLSLNTYGNASLETTVETNEVKAISSGNSTLVVNGSVDKINGRSDGNSSLLLSNCKSLNADVTSDGNSRLNVFATQEIVAHSSGNSSLSIKGDPLSKNTSSSGNSSLRMR